MAKRDKKPGPIDRPKDIGAALFLELMMQMLAFFILLTSMAVIVEEKRIAALGSLAGTFSPLPYGANIADGKGPAMPARDIVKGSSAPKRTAKALTEVAKQLGEKSLHILPLANQTVQIRFPERIAFASGQVGLSHKSDRLMDALAKIFELPDVIEIRIEGHTDDKPIRSSLYPSNWELSAARAMSVFRGLKERGVSPSRMIVAGMGDQHPIKGHPELNRRVEITLKFRPVTEHPEGAEHGKRDFRINQRAAVAAPSKGF